MSQIEKSEKTVNKFDSHAQAHEHATHALQNELHQNSHQQQGSEKSGAGAAGEKASADLAKHGVIGKMVIQNGDGAAGKGDQHQQPSGDTPKASDQAGKVGGDSNHSSGGKGEVKPTQDGGSSKGNLTDEDIKHIKEALEKMKAGDIFKNGGAKDIQNHDGNSKAMSPDIKRQIEEMMKDGNNAKRAAEELSKDPRNISDAKLGSSKDQPANHSDKNASDYLKPMTPEEQKKWTDLLKRKIEDPRTPEEKRQSMQNMTKE